MKHFILIAIVVLITVASGYQTVGTTYDNKPKSVKEQYGYPEPPISTKNLFFIQRSPNANLVQYELKFKDNGEIDMDDPIDIYWLRYNSTGQRRELKWFERKLAYGVKYDRLNENTWKVNLVSYKKRSLYLVRNDDGSYQTNIDINGKRSRFSSVFLDIEENTFFPKIGSVEIFGTDLETGEEVYERFVP